MTPVAPVRGAAQVRELLPIGSVVDVDPVSQGIVWEAVEALIVRIRRQHAADDDTKHDIHHVVKQPAAVGITGRVAGDESQAVCLCLEGVSCPQEERTHGRPGNSPRGAP